MEITQSEQQTERRMKKKKKEGNKRELWDNIKHANIHVIEISEGEERERGIENVFEEIMAENFLNLKKETDIQVQGRTQGSKQDEHKQTHTKTYHN